MAKGTNKNLQNTMHRKLIIEQHEHIITGDELMCSGMVISSFYTSGTRCVIRHETINVNRKENVG